MKKMFFFFRLSKGVLKIQKGLHKPTIHNGVCNGTNDRMVVRSSSLSSTYASFFQFFCFSFFLFLLAFSDIYHVLGNTLHAARRLGVDAFKKSSIGIGTTLYS